MPSEVEGGLPPVLSSDNIDEAVNFIYSIREAGAVPPKFAS